MILTEACKNYWAGEDGDYIHTHAHTLLRKEVNEPKESAHKKRAHTQTKNKSQLVFFSRFYSRFFLFSLWPLFFSMLYFIWELLLYFVPLARKNYCKRRKNCNLINKFVIFVVFVSGEGVCASMLAEIYVKGEKRSSGQIKGN